MFGKAPHVSALEMWKQLLIAESELNRAQLCEEWQKTAHGIHDLADRVKTIAGWTSATALLMAGLSTFRHCKVDAAEEKPSWFKRALKGAQLAGSILLAFRRMSGRGQA